MFASLFKRAEASVDNAVGDLGNRIVIAVPFLIALGFGAYSLSLTWTRFYGPEVGNLLVAAAFSVVGLIAAIVVKTRSAPKIVNEQEAETAKHTPEMGGSIFDNESLMTVIGTAAPVVLPGLLRTAMKNWALVMAVATGAYVFSQAGSASNPTTQSPD